MFIFHVRPRECTFIPRRPGDSHPPLPIIYFSHVDQIPGTQRQISRVCCIELVQRLNSHWQRIGLGIKREGGRRRRGNQLLRRLVGTQRGTSPPHTLSHPFTKRANCRGCGLWRAVCRSIPPNSTCAVPPPPHKNNLYRFRFARGQCQQDGKDQQDNSRG